jgi:hypothetical protein
MDLSLKWSTLTLRQKFVLLTLLTASILSPRIFELDHFVTPDEPLWLTRSTNFLLGLKDRNFAQTYQKEHPGVTVMWAGAFGYLWKYPQLLQEREGKLTRQYLFHILETNNHTPLEMLTGGRLFVVLGIVLTLVVSYPAAARLVGVWPALTGYFLLAIDSFSTALSRLLHVDGLLSAFMLLSLLTFMAYLYRGRRLLDLLLSGLAAGLAWLTKSPAFFLIPFFGLLALFELIRSLTKNRGLKWRPIWNIVWPLAAWFTIASAVFCFLWPAMWVSPVESLKGIFSGAVHYAGEGHDVPVFFNGQIYSSGRINSWFFYPLTFFWRTTPTVLIGLASAFGFGLLRWDTETTAKRRWVVLILSLFLLLYTVFMSLGTKKFDRYLLPIYAPACLIAGVGLLYIGEIVWRQANRLLKSRLWSGISLAIIVLFLAGASALPILRTFPYYLSYYNPLLGGAKKAVDVMMIGWGEGLDQAARYINALPEAGDTTVISWYNEGSFSFIYTGRRSLELFSPDYESLPDADYVVLYIHQWQRDLPSKEYLANYANEEPLYTIVLNGIPYAKIYRYKR